MKQEWEAFLQTLDPTKTTDSKLIPLLSYGLIQCQGPDVQKFLQGQISCDVHKVKQGHALFACYCDHKGRILTSMRVFKYQDFYYLSLAANNLEFILAELKKFAAFSKVTLENVSDTLLQVGIIGPAANDLDTTTINSIIPGLDQRSQIIASFGVLQTMTGNFALGKMDAWKLLDIADGIAIIDAENKNLFTPHDVNYHEIGAVDFNKGCYRGQEIIARMHYRGKLKTHLYKAHVDLTDAIPSASQIFNKDETAVGYVVNAAEKQLLISVKDTAAKENQMQLKSGQKVYIS